jgi:hypothetical protein
VDHSGHARSCVPRYRRRHRAPATSRADSAHATRSPRSSARWPSSQPEIPGTACDGPPGGDATNIASRSARWRLSRSRLVTDGIVPTCVIASIGVGIGLGSIKCWRSRYRHSVRPCAVSGPSFTNQATFGEIHGRAPRGERPAVPDSFPRVRGVAGAARPVLVSGWGRSGWGRYRRPRRSRRRSPCKSSPDRPVGPSQKAHTVSSAARSPPGLPF